MTDAEWLRTDLPIVTSAGVGRSCASCGNWSPWLSETGDCLFHAYTRRQQMIDDAPPADRLPLKSARMTSADEVCDGWKAIGR